MIRSVWRRVILCAATLVLLAWLAGHSWAHLHSASRGLPYQDSFSGGTSAEWKAFGGTWELENGAMRNDSDERGAKLMTGSRYWTNYSVEADVRLLGTDGDVGLMIRSSDEEQGVDSYTGYYAGIRSLDNSLVIGRAEHGWMENALALKPFSTQGAPWYHLKVLAYGCQIVASALQTTQNTSATVSVTDQHCLRSGRAGLRSYASGGVWRNVVIKPATQQDLSAMLDYGRQSGLAAEQDLFQNREVHGFGAPLPQNELYTFHSSLNTQPISSLRLVSSAEQGAATIRGTVVLTSPLLFVQDATGGVSVPSPAVAPSLKLGEQVEVTGSVKAGDFSSALEYATVRSLWEGTPMPPVNITVSQAATGAFDATFIEVEGRLLDKQYSPDNTLVLTFDVGSQSFRAIMNRGRGDDLFRKLMAGSLLRLRGVCVVDAAFTHNLTPFILLLRSTDDVDVLAGPPWWSTGHLVALGFGFLLLALVGNFIYHRVEHWRLHAVLEERERLAHEMHDTLAQSFAGIGFQLEAIRCGIPESYPVTHQQLNLASELVRHSHEEARRSIATLRPERDGPSDLLAALDLCARHMVEGGTVQVSSSTHGDPVSIPLRITDTLYRIGQEAIANAVRHAHPTQLTISLGYTAERVCLAVVDNGVGFVQSGDLRGFGVRGMRKRAAGIAATFQILSTPRQGTLVQATAPLPARSTLTTWPRFLWIYLRKLAPHVESAH